MCAATFLFFTGPVFARWLTASVNEQPAIWCLYSVVQNIFFVFAVRYKELYKQPVPKFITHPGGRGEQPLTYIRYLPREGEIVQALLVDVPSGATNGDKNI